MTYFLDFDRTLFDTDAFLPYLANVPELSEFTEAIQTVLLTGRGESLSSNEERETLWKSINALYEQNHFTFAKGELTQFVYADATDFLKRHGHESIIVTSSGIDNLFQKGKLMSSGIDQLVLDTAFVVAGDPKGPVVLKLMTTYRAPYVFVDDLVAQIDSVAHLSSEVVGYEMRRDGKPGSGRYPVIQTLFELP